MMTELQEQQFELDYDKFLQAGFLFTGKNPDGRYTVARALELVRYWTKIYMLKNNAGASSQSAFQIVHDALVGEKEIVPLAVEPEPEVHELTVQEYRSMPVRQIQVKYRRDPVFKAQVERLIADGLI